MAQRWRVLVYVTLEGRRVGGLLRLFNRFFWFHADGRLRVRRRLIVT